MNSAQGASKKIQTRLVESTDQINALISPTRQEIIDTLQAMGTASVPDLARQMARPADALYYHVRALSKAGLLQQVDTRQIGRHQEAVYATLEPEKRLKLLYRSEQPAATEAITQLVASMLRASGRDFARAIGDPSCQLDGPRRELWAGRIKGWVSPTELERINVLLDELTQLFAHTQDDKRNRLYSLQFLLAPNHRDATHTRNTEPATLGTKKSRQQPKSPTGSR